MYKKTAKMFRCRYKQGKYEQYLNYLPLSPYEMSECVTKGEKRPSAAATERMILSHCLLSHQSPAFLCTRKFFPLFFFRLCFLYFLDSHVKSFVSEGVLCVCGFQTLLPVGSSNELFTHPPPLFPTSRLYNIRPYHSKDKVGKERL